MNTIERLKHGIFAFATVCTLAGCGQSAYSGALPSDLGAASASVAAAGKGPAFRVFTAGKKPGLPATAVPRDLALDASGSVWFTDVNTPAIGRIEPSLKIQEFGAGLTSGAHPYSIVLGPDGNMWFSDCVGAIGRVTRDGAIAEFRTPHSRNAAPLGITAGADGALWSVALGPPEGQSFLLRMTVRGKASAFPIPRALVPDGSLQADGAGNLWFFASLANHDVVFVQYTNTGKFVSHATGLVTKGEPCCPNLAPKHIALGADGHLWFTTPYFGLPSDFAKLFGTFASGKSTFFPASTERIGYPVYPSGVASTRKFLWFAGSDPIGTNGAIWKMSPAGTQRSYAIPYNPAALVQAGDKTLWFASQVQGRAPQIVEAIF